MANEAQIMSEAYDVLSMSEEPLSTVQLQRQLTTKVSQADLDSMLRRTVYGQDGIAKGYTPGTFVQVDNRWSVRPLGTNPHKNTFKPESIIAAII